MNKQAVSNISVAAFLLMTLLTAGSAAAQTNTVYGSGALESPASNDLGDSAFGVGTLDSPTSGINNTAIGLQALTSNTTGKDNTASGVS